MWLLVILCSVKQGHSPKKEMEGTPRITAELNIRNAKNAYLAVPQ